MKSVIPPADHDLKELARNFIGDPSIKEDALLKLPGLQKLSLNAQGPIFYVVDFIRQKYLHLDSSCKTALGYEIDFLLEAGPVFIVSLWHENDRKVFKEKIIGQTIQFLKMKRPSPSTDYSFSFNYRIRSRNGSYLTIFQRCTYLINDINTKLLAAAGFILDITHFKEDTRIIFTIEKVNTRFSDHTPEPVFKAVYYPDNTGRLLSCREHQILQLIREGYASKEIADKLFISINTINNHRKNMLSKTNTKSTSELIYFAQKKGIL